MATYNGITGKFFGLPVATLNAMLTTWLECLNAIAVAGQSYTIANRQFNRAQIEEVTAMVAEIQAAIERANGSRVTKTYSRFTPAPY